MFWFNPRKTLKIINPAFVSSTLKNPENPSFRASSPMFSPNFPGHLPGTLGRWRWRQRPKPSGWRRRRVDLRRWWRGGSGGESDVALGEGTQVSYRVPWRIRFFHHDFYLIGGLEHFLFFHVLGIVIPTDKYFAEGLKPPTSYVFSWANSGRMKETQHGNGYSWILLRAMR